MSKIQGLYLLSILFLISFYSSGVCAQNFDIFSTSNDSFKYDNYYDYSAVRRNSINLLKPNHVDKHFPQVTSPYNRSLHFGGWVRGQNQSCLDTRGLVLLKSSSQQIEVSSTCVVKKGQWHDPYTDKIFTDAKLIQIDHLVPLRNAYMSGAFSWSKRKRCAYANYIGNAYHLLAVYGSENLKKGDKTPDQYVPKNNKYVCEYLKQWLKVKFIWNLKITPLEFSGINREIKSNHCDASEFFISTTEANEQKLKAKNSEDVCL